MEKRTLIAIILSIGILMGYNIILSKSTKTIPSTSVQSLPAQSMESSGNQAVTALVKPASVGLSVDVEKNEKLIEKTVGKYIFYISENSGSIKKIYLNEYKQFILTDDLLYTDVNRPGLQYSVQSGANYLEIIGLSEGKEIISKKVTVEAPHFLRCRIEFMNKTLSDHKVGFHVKRDPNEEKARYQELVYKKDYLTTRIPLHKVKQAIQLTELKFFGSREIFNCLVLLNIESQRLDIVKEGNGSIAMSLLSDKPEIEFSLFVGPQKQKELEKYGISEINHYGFFHPISMILMRFLNFAHTATRNWGISIILITILINFLMLPLTKKSTQSMREMQKVQGEVDKLRARLKDNPQKLNQEIMELYKIHKINPLSGCLPWLLQIPVFFGFFQILNRFVEINGATFLWIKDLSMPDHLIKLPISLPFGLGDYFNILPILMTGIMFLQQKVTMTQTSQAQAEQQKMMMIVLPIVMGFVFYKFSAALVLYWLTNSLMMFIYQYSVLKKK